MTTKAAAQKRTSLKDYGKVDKQYKQLGTASLEYILPSKHTKAFSLLHPDPDMGQRALRYCTNQKTPFMDEQDANATLGHIIFENGFFNAPANDPVLQWFLDIHPLNGRKFKEVDASKEAEEELAIMEKQDEAIEAYKRMDDEEIHTFARIMFGGSIDRKTILEKKVMLRKHAKNKPNEFLASFKDPELTHKSMVYKAFEQKVLEIKFGNQVFVNLPANKEKLMNLPKGSSSKKELLVASFLKEKENHDICKEIEEQLEIIENSKDPSDLV